MSSQISPDEMRSRVITHLWARIRWISLKKPVFEFFPTEIGPDTMAPEFLGLRNFLEQKKCLNRFCFRVSFKALDFFSGIPCKLDASF